MKEFIYLNEREDNSAKGGDRRQDPSTGVEVGWSGVESQPQLYSKSEASLGCMRPRQNKTKQNHQKLNIMMETGLPLNQIWLNW